MHYNPEKQIAVFLGPSLEKSQAKNILDAQYYPPARMGDIYRIIGSGVRIIALIDGIFHNEIPVWQRELLEAVDNNITVIGASSMGALRAAELHPFGMVGHGTIFEWYRDNIIDGDDEVALNHGDESSDFRHFSEPLVNIRFNLMEAEKRKYVSSEKCEELIQCAKDTYYVERSYQSLLDSPIVQALPPQESKLLKQFITGHSIDLKKRDAASALHYCASLINNYKKPSVSLSPEPDRGGYKFQNSLNGRHRMSHLNRGFLRERTLIKSEAFLSAVLKDENPARTLLPSLIKNYYLLLWAREKKLICPSDFLDNFIETFKKDHFNDDYCNWLSANGLTDQELCLGLKERALTAWIFTKTPDHFGLNFKPYIQFVEAAVSGNSFSQKNEFLKRASESCFLSTWANGNGIKCPQSDVEKFIDEWEKSQQIADRNTRLTSMNMTRETYLSLLADRALSEWIVAKGPHYFGYTSWSFEFALIKELQVTGRAAYLIKEHFQ